ncbi:hypothetical protein GFM09_33590 [Rhizobium leguminosarum bv. viciae]|uniref:hypothetical protein n=1 Tax=Rhizobium leguminosarum TaxID=384 RepID=UPI001441372F|nr:hypothetical protein [Rhizobium leguminosarum]NKL74080.1 hypothetical protein [Rhizobium leguminosarum bv. viciae]
MADTAVTKALLIIEKCADAKKLRQIAANARERGQISVAHAADLRLYEVLPSEKPGTLEHDVWKSIHALEDTLTKERGTTTRLGRTRPKIARVGELETIKDLIMRKEPSEGFFKLLERQMPELTFEAVALRHPNQFEAAVVEAAEERLRAAGISL